MLAFYRQALAFRRTCAPIQFGDITFIEASEDILAFTRSHRGETILCLYNLSREPLDWTLPSAFTSAIVDPISAPGITLNRKRARLPARGWAFLR
ncbi:MAG: alpha-glucosidase C-terminal domain-containing protein [Rhizorhabdus sp.]